jgi:OmpA-OmpF porin, OOP family
MRRYPTIISAAVALAMVMLAAGTALAQSPATPTEGDISRSLAPKSRGLPNLGDMPPPPRNPPIAPASTGAAKKRVMQVSQPQPDAHPSATFRTIQFEFGSAVLTPDSIETLKNLGKALNHELSDQSHFRIEGHTDAYGEAGYNEHLSKDRADTVKDFLVKQMGVADGRLEAVGKGAAEPVQGASPYSGVNRRVVVVNLEG